MLRIEQLSIVLTLMLLCIQGSVSLAQKDINYWGPDTTLPAPRFLQTYGDILDYNFKHVDQFMSTDILADRNPNVTRREHFDGHRLDEAANLDDFHMIRAEMEDARVPYPDEIKTLWDIHKEVEAHYEATGEVIVGICDYDYEEITQEAKDNGDAFWDGYQVRFQGGKDPSEILEQKNTFVMLPLLSDIATDGAVTFNFSLEHIYTNLDDYIDHIAVDFGDGNGFVNLIIGQSYTAYYTEHGDHELTMLVNYVNRGYKQVRGKFSTRAAATVITVDCGDDIPVFDGTAYVELPQAQFDVIVPEVIPNEKNEGEVATRAGIWYGCGDPCVLDKPFIIITGYGPNIGKKNIWSDDPVKNLYSHFNGIYGQDAEIPELAAIANGTNLLYKLRNEGFDIVILEFLNGVDYPQNHAAAVMRLIELVNEEKERNGSMYENILMGQSMGGITSRIALARWEKERMSANSSPFVHHECSTWINWEGEMQGATIPIGIQLYAKYLLDDLPFYIATGMLESILPASIVGPASAVGGYITDYWVDISYFYEALNNPAAKSILTYHFGMNDQGNDPILYRHPLYLALFAEMDRLGYPQHVRRVAIADGSSTAERPLGLKRDANGNALNTCLMDLNTFIPVSNALIRIRINTGELHQSKTVFRGWLAIKGVPVPAAIKNVKKIYTKAEYDAPGSYERFYKKFVLGVGKFGFKGCKSPNYRAPFVPTTSVFDVQDDYSLDYGYNCHQNLFFKEYNELDNNQSSGFPHNNPAETIPYEKTPFDACFANQENTFHNQNPGTDLASFILSEVARPEMFIQNLDYSAIPVEHQSLFESPVSIMIGNDVTATSRQGDVLFGSSNKAFIRSPEISVKSGTYFMEGSEINLRSESPDNRGCVIITQDKRGQDLTTLNSQYPKSRSQLDYGFSVYPNPNNGKFWLDLPEDVHYRVELRDLTGRLLETMYLDRSSQVQINHSNGIFFVKVFEKQTTYPIYSTKIIKL